MGFRSPVDCTTARWLRGGEGDGGPQVQRTTSLKRLRKGRARRASRIPPPIAYQCGGCGRERRSTVELREMLHRLKCRECGHVGFRRLGLVPALERKATILVRDQAQEQNHGHGYRCPCAECEVA